MNRAFHCILITLILTLYLSCVHRILRKPEEPAGPHVKIVTWNVNWGMPQPNETLRILRNINADIICLQETTPDWERFLSISLKGTYPFMNFRHEGGAGGQALFSKKSIKELEYILPAEGWFPGWVNEFETDIGSIQILSVHLHPTLNNKGSFSVGAYLSTPEIRLGEIQTLFPHLKKETATIVLGDFNEGDSSNATEWAVKQGYTDALAEFDYSANTCEWQTSYITLKKRFDHILYSKELYCLNAMVIHGGGSDHFPVVAMFEKRTTK